MAFEVLARTGKRALLAGPAPGIGFDAQKPSWLVVSIDVVLSTRLLLPTQKPRHRCRGFAWLK
jgi:hypothetical protein